MFSHSLLEAVPGGEWPESGVRGLRAHGSTEQVVAEISAQAFLLGCTLSV